ncbi:MmgE/PrpD family protein [Polaromonas hydrogenivorans]|uniref:MmgE/PrpD family protein n=1 Tax=Polaromonas hydrogenivorans TaxID=335476 RepID=A0AAU7LY78_9BURK
MIAVPLTRVLVQTLRSLHGDILAPHVVRSTKLHIADSTGIALAGRREAVLMSILLDAVGPLSVGAAHGCSVLGGTERLPLPAAAFANAALAHLLDYDDIHDLARLHPTTVTFPAALAAAELVGAHGDRIVSAVALGNELMCRLALLCSPTAKGPGADWFLTQLFGYAGAALAAGIVLGLTDDELVSAIGFAYMQSAGGKEAGFGVGSNARAIYPAFAAMGGMTAALLARSGLVGPEGSLDGAAGLLRIYLGLESTPELRKQLLQTERWHATDTSFKPWPCCRLSHPYVAAALQLQAHTDFRKIERVVVSVNGSANRLCQPLAQRRRPQTLQDAKYSIPYMTAFSLVHGEVTLANLHEASLADVAVLALADRIEVDASLPDNPGHPPARIRIELPGESKTSGEISSPLLELDTSQVHSKFIDCASYAGHADAQGLWRMLLELEQVSAADFLNAARIPPSA